jgi:hypothetical protein
MTATIDYLPVWKKGAPVHERLQELAEIARKHPDWFQKWVLVYCEDNEQRFKVRVMQGEETRTSDVLAVLSAGSMHVWEDTRKEC